MRVRPNAIVACLVVLLGGVHPGGSDESSATPVLVEGEPRPVEISRATGLAGFETTVPEGAEALHVFACFPRAIDVSLEAGPVDDVGGFVERTRQERRDGRIHLVCRAPTAGRHRIVVGAATGSGGGAGRIELAYDRPGVPPVVDLTLGRIVPGVRLVRLFVPPHEGIARLVARPAHNAAAPRVLFRAAADRLGEPSDLPIDLSGTQPGGLFELAVLSGAAERLHLEVPPAGEPYVAPPAEPIPLRAGGGGVTVSMGGAAPDRLTFALVVEPGSPRVAIRAKATARGGDERPDPDLYARRNRAIDDPFEDADTFGIAHGPAEELLLGGTEGTLAGTWYVVVDVSPSDLPTDVKLDVEALKVPPPAREVPLLALERWTSSQLDVRADGSPVRWFRVPVPEGASSLDVQVVDASSDLDLVAVDPRTGLVVARSLEAVLDERLFVRFPLWAPIPATSPSELLVGVVSRVGDESEATFRVAVAADGPVRIPDDVRLPPFARPHPGTLDPLIDAAAEVLHADGAGSAVCIHPDGWFLTCRHVLEDGEGDLATSPVWLALVDDVRRSPRQSFRAEIVESDAELDLALVRVVEDVYRRRGSGPRRLVAARLAVGDAPATGERLAVVGFPGDSTERSRPPVAISRGDVVGLESAVRSADLVWIKTDAWIAPGHSGAGVYDTGGALVGIACATLGRNDALGLVRPIARVPRRWVDLLPPRGDGPKGGR